MSQSEWAQIRCLRYRLGVDGQSDTLTVMPNMIHSLRPVLTQNERDFGALLSRVLSPARPLQSEEFLRGREEQLAGIKQALYQPGRHVLVYGFRGVGKSSLAQTAAFSLSEGTDPILLGCDEKTSFRSIIRDVFDEVTMRDPKIDRVVRERGISFEHFGITAGMKVTTEEHQPSAPGSVNEAVRLLQFLCESYKAKPVIVVDEFDQIKNKEEQVNFTNFVKQISDKHVPVKFIFCGIGDSIEALMSAHGSADRYFHTVELGRLPWEARFEIVQVAATSLGIEIDESTLFRVARISDGFPHYVHFIAEKLFWRVFHAGNGGLVNGDLFGIAMSDAALSMDMKLRAPYDKATQKYSNEYSWVLWAVADGHELRRRSTDIFSSYLHIAAKHPARDTQFPPLERAKFNQRLNALKRENHGCILSGTRAGWYEFSEKVVRGYVRLRAEQEGVILEADHPNAKRRS